MTTGHSTARWLKRLGPTPSTMPALVCFPHAGGSASYYLPLLRRLWPAVDVHVVQYPGREDRSAEPMVATIADLADQLGPVLRALPHRRVVLFGHSMGALVAFEVARRLVDHGASPERLIVSGHAAPGWPRRARWHELAEDRLVEKVRGLGGTDEIVLRHPRLLAAALAVVRGDLAAAETYRPGPGRRLSCPVSAMVGDRDPLTSLDAARAWATVTTGAFDLEIFAGGHFQVMEQRDAVVEALLRRLTETDPVTA